jgi:isopenicillin N synthase-like dioxygenase
MALSTIHRPFVNEELGNPCPCSFTTNSLGMVQVNLLLFFSIMLSSFRKKNSVVNELLQHGVAVQELMEAQATIHRTAFATAKRALHTDLTCQRIGPNEDSAHATGYHAAGGLSRYNQYREGFVFSDGMSFGMNTHSNNMPEWERDMQSLFTSLHGIAQKVLTELEQEWILPNGWFQNTLGDTSLHSQWHMKRYVGQSEDNGVLLPIHTDPSLLSVIIHDAPGIQQRCMGLQYQATTDDGTREWRDVPHHGHFVATIMVGSVLSYITGGQVAAAKHRVVVDPSTSGERMAATLFLRPRGSAMMMVPPSSTFENVVLKKQRITFDSWNEKVARNYEKGKQQS